MRNLLSLLVLFWIPALMSVSAQSLDQVNKRIDSLTTIKKNLEVRIRDMQDQLKDTRQKLEDLEAKKAALNTVSSSGNIKVVIAPGGAILRDNPNSTGSVITTIPEKSTVYVNPAQQNLYFKTTYNGKTGWINYSCIQTNAELDQALAGGNSTSNNTSTTTVVRNVDTSDPKYQRLAKIYGADKAKKIMNNELWEGMSPGQAMESIGKPVSKTNVNTLDGTQEHWNYSDKTLIFMNGELLSWSKK
jgi:hypothetical protein